MFTLRPYQTTAFNALRENAKNRVRKQCLRLRCGSGKTVVCAHVMHNAEQKGKRSIFIVHRRNLVDQCADHLTECGIPSTVIMAGRKRSQLLTNPIVVASRDTLLQMMRDGKADELPPADLLVIDEGHMATGAGYRKIIDHYMAQGAYLLLLTATPAGPNGTGLGDVCEKIVSVATSEQLIEDGFIVPTRVFAPCRVDATGDDRRKSGRLADKMNRKELVGDIIDHWREIADGRPTVAFACRTDHARHIRDMFVEAGITAAYVDAETPDDERERIKSDMEAGKIKVVCNVDIISIGTNWPFLSCAIDAAPTNSIVRALQRWGRISRPYGSKRDALLLDHADNCPWLGIHPDDDFDWPLSPSQKLKKKEKKQHEERELKMCDSCYAMYYGSSCPNCGKQKSTSFKVKQGRLVEVDRNLEKKVPTHEVRDRKWRSLIRIGYHKGWSLKVCRAAFKAEFGDYPKDGEFAEHPGGSRWPLDGMNSYQAKDMKVREIWTDLVGRKTKPEPAGLW